MPKITLIGDFETTVYSGQTETEVWASALVEMYTENVLIFNSIDKTYHYLLALNTDIDLYYHNLKFDGSFWVDFLLTKVKLQQAYRQKSSHKYDVEWLPDKEMENNTFKYSISSRGMWYTITIKINNHFIRIKDSYKLLPFSLKRIGKAFKTKHQKTSIQYKGIRHANQPISDDEKDYISNDVLVIKEALEVTFGQGHTQLTIGSCCLEEFKKTHDKIEYNAFFPNLYEVELDKSIYGSANVGEYIRKSYHGGWCYVVPEKRNQIKYTGCTADVNSLYPSVMSGESGNKYPVGLPHFWSGDYIPMMAQQECTYFFVRVRTRFKIKEGKLPTIQIKTDLKYNPREWLTTSDVWDAEHGRYCSRYIDLNGNEQFAYVTLTTTMTDYYLMLDHYELIDCTILDGCWFYSQVGLFDEYINRYKQIKMTSTGALRELAKLFLNNLYGKLATNTDSSFKVAYIKENGCVGYVTVTENNKTPGYIACGTAVTSYARNFTIRTAQKNYHGANKRGFIYADTDSIHCDLQPDELIDVPIHETDFCHWKLESEWDFASFVRQKTYIEHIIIKDGGRVEPYYDIKCAGMPDRCKKLLEISMLHDGKNTPKLPDGYEEIEKEAIEFISTPRTIKDFTSGLIIPGNLKAKVITGGTVLVDLPYEMR